MIKQSVIIHSRIKYHSPTMFSFPNSRNQLNCVELKQTKAHIVTIFMSCIMKIQDYAPELKPIFHNLISKLQDLLYESDYICKYI